MFVVILPTLESTGFEVKVVFIIPSLTRRLLKPPNPKGFFSPLLNAVRYPKIYTSGHCFRLAYSGGRVVVQKWIYMGMVQRPLYSKNKVFFIPILFVTQQDYYGRRCGTLLHSYCTSTYTEVTVLLLWSSSNAALEYQRRHSNRVVVWVLHGNTRVTSQEQYSYFSVGTSAVTV